MPTTIPEQDPQDLARLERRLAELEEENARLAAEAKRLVRTENELYRTQRQLDDQIHLYRQLYKVGHQLNTTFELGDILDITTRFVLYELNFERCLVLLAGESTFRVAALDGYYDAAARLAAASLGLPAGEASLAALLAGAPPVLCYAGCAQPTLLELGQRLGMDEYALLLLGEPSQALGLLAAGNTAGMANYQTRVQPDSNAMVGLANLAGQAATAIHNVYAYQALRKSEQKYRTLFENSRDAILITSSSGQFVNANQATLDLLGYTWDELAGMDVGDIYASPLDRAEFQREMAQAGSVRDFEVRFKKKDGSLIDGLLTATVQRAEDDSSLTYQGIIRDVTERKRAEGERLKLSAIQHELAIAQDIQHSLLPPDRPDWPDLDVVCYSVPAREVGGDFYAYHAFGQARPERCFGLAVGDVSGKGMPAALLMAVSLASFQSAVGQHPVPGELLAHLERAISPYTRTTHQNCALVYVHITLGQQPSLCAVNAGCITPIVRRADGSVQWVEVGGVPLGMGLGEQPTYAERRLALSPGDLLLLVSDGIVEANNPAGDMFGFERLGQAIASGPADSAQAMLAHLTAQAAGFVGGRELRDDMTVVVARVCCPPDL